jgi:hypothetical protein
MKILTVPVFLLLITLSTAAQVSSDNLSGQLHNFEAGWLSANLNGDQQWKQRFTERKLGVVPADTALVGKRALEVYAILDPGLAPNEMKVRITGTVTLITNDHVKDRSFRFLDTFNKKGGKWEIIATGLTPVSDWSPTSDAKPVETSLIDLENSLTRSASGNNLALLDTLIAPEFVGTSADGTIQNRAGWLRTAQEQKNKTTKVDDISVHMVSDSVAIVTGIRHAGNVDGASGKERFTRTWLNRDGGWQLVAAQQTRLP